MQRLFSSSMKHANTTIFKLKQSNVYAFVMFKIYLFMSICNQAGNEPYLFQCFVKHNLTVPQIQWTSVITNLHRTPQRIHYNEC